MGTSISTGKYARTSANTACKARPVGRRRGRVRTRHRGTCARRRRHQRARRSVGSEHAGTCADGRRLHDDHAGGNDAAGNGRGRQRRAHAAGISSDIGRKRSISADCSRSGDRARRSGTCTSSGDGSGSNSRPGAAPTGTLTRPGTCAVGARRGPLGHCACAVDAAGTRSGAGCAVTAAAVSNTE